MIGAATVHGQTPGTGPAPECEEGRSEASGGRGEVRAQCGGRPPHRPREPVELPPALADALAEFNRGAANMEKYEYAKAARAFNKVLEVSPDWTAARFNRGLAYLNMAGANDPDKRLGPTQEMVDTADRDVRANRAEGPRTSAVSVLPRHASGLPG